MPKHSLYIQCGVSSNLGMKNVKNMRGVAALVLCLVWEVIPSLNLFLSDIAEDSQLQATH